MKYIITANDALERGCWDKLCEMFGINPWAMSEGLMESTEEFTLTEKQAKKLGFIE